MVLVGWEKLNFYRQKMECEIVNMGNDEVSGHHVSFSCLKIWVN